MMRRWTAIIEREGDGLVALCPELDLASQGDSAEAARENLRAALGYSLDTPGQQRAGLRLAGASCVTWPPAPAAPRSQIGLN